jgi:ABC-type siderophore export system fused ATPase/permease subunit
LNYLLYKKDLLFQKKLEKQTKKENILVNNRNLIIKKNGFYSFQDKYKPIVKETCQVASQSDFLYTLAWATPSYSLIPLAQIIFLPFAKSEASFVASDMLLKLFDELKKMIERLKDYPYYFSAKKRLNEFLLQPERNDLQKNLLITEPIESITLKDVSFSYGDKVVLNKFNLVLVKGKLNHLTGANGFGKSTIINLITCLYQPNKGEILVNDKHDLKQTNLHL